MKTELVLTCPFNCSVSLSLTHTSLPQLWPLALFHAMFAAQTLSSGAVAVLSWNQWRQSLIKSSSACLPRAGLTNRYSFPIFLHFSEPSESVHCNSDYERVRGSIRTPKCMATITWLPWKYLHILSFTLFSRGREKWLQSGPLMKGILEASVDTVSARPITTQPWRGEVWESKGEGDALSSRMGEEKRSVCVCVRMHLNPALWALDTDTKYKSSTNYAVMRFMWTETL